jgi:hypothetical protein
LEWGITTVKEITDKLTYAIKIATDILFVRNPVGTSMGVLGGVIFHGVVGVLSPTIQAVDAIRVSSLNIFHYIAFGVFSFNVKGFYSRHKVSKEVEEAILFIDEQVRKGMYTKIEAKQRYRELINRVVENVQLDTNTGARIQNITDTLGSK